MNFRNWVRRNFLDRRGRFVEVPKDRRTTKSYKEAHHELCSSLDRATVAVKKNNSSMPADVGKTIAHLLRNKK